MREKIEAALDEIRPVLASDGGGVELVSVEDGIIKVKLQGACGGCPMATLTLKNVIERVLKQRVPEVKSVESV